MRFIPFCEMEIKWKKSPRIKRSYDYIIFSNVEEYIKWAHLFIDPKEN